MSVSETQKNSAALLAAAGSCDLFDSLQAQTLCRNISPTLAVPLSALTSCVARAKCSQTPVSDKQHHFISFSPHISSRCSGFASGMLRATNRAKNLLLVYDLLRFGWILQKHRIARHILIKRAESLTRLAAKWLPLKIKSLLSLCFRSSRK